MILLMARFKKVVVVISTVSNHRGEQQFKCYMFGWGWGCCKKNGMTSDDG
jgi:hypothetical protein